MKDMTQIYSEGTRKQYSPTQKQEIKHAKWLHKIGYFSDFDLKQELEAIEAWS